jgi:hypothetical protein
MSHGGGGAPVTGGTGGGILQHRKGKERVRRTPLASHDARRTGLSRRRRLDAGGGSIFRCRGGEATREWRGQAQWGEAGRQWRLEQTEKKNGRRGARSAVSGFFLVAQWHVRGGKRGQGVRGAAPRGAENGADRGGRGAATWTGMTRMRQLQATPTAMDGAHLTGTAVIGEGGGGASDAGG